MLHKQSKLLCCSMDTLRHECSGYVPFSQQDTPHPESNPSRICHYHVPNSGGLSKACNLPVTSRNCPLMPSDRTSTSNDPSLLGTKGEVGFSNIFGHTSLCTHCPWTDEMDAQDCLLDNKQEAVDSVRVLNLPCYSVNPSHSGVSETHFDCSRTCSDDDVTCSSGKCSSQLSADVESPFDSPACSPIETSSMHDVTILTHNSLKGKPTVVPFLAENVPLSVEIFQAERIQEKDSNENLKHPVDVLTHGLQHRFLYSNASYHDVTFSVLFSSEYSLQPRGNVLSDITDGVQNRLGNKELAITQISSAVDMGTTGSKVIIYLSENCLPILLKNS